MGMFDSVMAACECGADIEFQTKSGPCECAFYRLADAPENVLLDVNRHAPLFCDCGQWLEVDIPNRILKVVPPPPAASVSGAYRWGSPARQSLTPPTTLRPPK